MHKKIKNIPIFVGILTVLLISVFVIGKINLSHNEFVGPRPDTVKSNDTERNIKWVEDIDYFKKLLNGYISRTLDIKNNEEDARISEVFTLEIERLKNDIPYLNNFEIEARIQMITALFHDGHMATEFLWESYYKNALPLSFTLYEDGIYCTTVFDKSYKNALNCKLNAINGVSIDTISDRFEIFFTGDNIYDSKSKLSRRINCPQVLKGLEIIESIEDPVTFTLTTLEGDTFDLYVDKRINQDINHESFIKRDEGDEAFFNRDVKNDKDYWIEFLEENNILYIRSYYIPHTNALDKLNENILNILTEKQVDKIVLDLRGNEGGQITLEHSWNDTLISFGNETGHLYVITDYDTFSMGAVTAIYLKEKGNAVIIGLPPSGGAPKVADMTPFELPNSDFMVNIPQNKFRSKVKINPNLKDNILEPDIQTGIDINNYIHKTDPVLELIKTF
ncbi:S41 family peptidase [Anaeropeptidivorans aminofermentans]|jgi:hypothetical protein|uniref:S41 family peptidase n=1 Tax=Anaeropeptidivorans aminofermentans TaxID=2934315 RepID=UPI0020249652|nr:S41 family peptidase [Anaeropeptidivorans aminofermentans]